MCVFLKFPAFSLDDFYIIEFTIVSCIFFITISKDVAPTCCISPREGRLFDVGMCSPSLKHKMETLFKKQSPVAHRLREVAVPGFTYR